MTIEETVFEKIAVDKDKLEDSGFIKNGDAYTLKMDFCNDAFTAVLTIDQNMHLNGKVIEKAVNEEYLPLRAWGASGRFVQTVREAYIDLLKNIALKIGSPRPFVSDQANRIAVEITREYGDAPDFPWADNPSEENRNNCIFRHENNQKWYALFMYIPSSKVLSEAQREEKKKQEERERQQRIKEKERRLSAKKEGKKLPPLKRRKKKSEDDPKIDILNLKVDPASREELLCHKGIYPSFHMHQKSWISVRLDDEVPDESIMKLVERSWQLTRSGGKRNREGRKTWIIPANPKYYDLISVFAKTDDTIWKQGKGIETGDIVYMYVAVPYSAILYKCTVSQAYSSQDDTSELMDIHIEERYDRKLCPLSLMKQYHVTTVRGPRFMPEELEKYIEHAYNTKKQGK